VIRPQSAEKVGWYCESPEVAAELGWPLVTHLLVHQELVDALLLGE